MRATVFNQKRKPGSNDEMNFRSFLSNGIEGIEVAVVCFIAFLVLVIMFSWVCYGDLRMLLELIKNLATDPPTQRLVIALTVYMFVLAGGLGAWLE